MNCLRLFVLISAFFYSGFAFAIPNVWESTFGQGNQEYYITNKKITLGIGCNSTTGFNFDHNLHLYNSKNVDLFTKPKHVLSFLIGGEVFEFGTNKSGKVETSYRNAANLWRNFIEAIHKARRIEVYYDDKKIVEYQPRNINFEDLKFMPEACSPLFYRDDSEKMDPGQ